MSNAELNALAPKPLLDPVAPMSEPTPQNATVTEAHLKLACKIWYSNEYGLADVAQLIANFVQAEKAKLYATQESEIPAAVAEALKEVDEANARAEHAEAEWQSQAKLVKEAVEREAKAVALYQKQFQDACSAIQERDGLAARVTVLREALQLSHDCWHAMRKHNAAARTAAENCMDETERWQIEEALRSTPASASAELTALRAEVARLKADTERYRITRDDDGQVWLHLKSPSGKSAGVVLNDIKNSIANAAISECLAIDAARKTTP